MNFLIRQFAAYIARRIESGNLLFAALGAAIGLLGGCLGGWAAWRGGWVDTLGGAALIVGALVGAFIGAFVGSKVPGAVESDRPNRLPSTRANNANQALALPGLVLIATGILTPLTALAGREDPRYYLWAAAAGFAGLVLCLLIASYPILLIEIGVHLTVRRLFSSRDYDRTAIARWGFETTRGRYSRVPPTEGMGAFTIEFKDRQFFQVIVSPIKARQLAAAMERFEAT